MANEFSLLSIYHKLIDRLDRLCTSRFWRIKITALSVLIALIVSFPKAEWLVSISGYQFSAQHTAKYPHLADSFLWGHWKGFSAKRDNPFAASKFSDDEHEAKMALRLFMPLSARILGLTNQGVVWFQSLLGIAFFYFAIRFIERRTGDRVSAALFSFSLAPLMCGYAGLLSLGAKFDGVAFFGLILSLALGSPLAIFLGIQIACWTDERAILASILVMLFYFLDGLVGAGKNRLSLRLQQSTLVVIFSVLFFVGLRLYLQQTTGLSTPVGESSGIKLQNLGRMTELYWTGVWSALRGGWFVVFVMLIALLARRRYFSVLLVCLASVPNLLGGFLVFDVSRSCAYVFPVLCIAATQVSYLLARAEVRALLLFSWIVSMFSPPLHLVAGEVGKRWPYGLIYVADQSIFNRAIEFVYYFIF